MRQLFIILSLVILLYSCSEDHKPTFYAYEDATLPMVLGEGSLSNNTIEWNNVYIEKTKEIYFTTMGSNVSHIMVRKYADSIFTEASQINFTDESPHTDVYVNAEGNLMLFSSLMPEHKTDTVSDWNIWRSDRENGKWQSPKPFFPENVEDNQFYPWLTNSGNLYFAITPHGSQNSDLYVSEFKEGKYLAPQALPGYINSDKLESDAFVAPDESFLIFAGFERTQNLGKSDLYISFNEDGHWSSPVWMGEEINSEGYDGSPFVTADGKFLIFTSSRGSTDDNTFFNHYIVKFSAERWSDKG